MFGGLSPPIHLFFIPKLVPRGNAAAWGSFYI
nr:MAG TPA: TarM [Caudoviricetes sp.]